MADPADETFNYAFVLSHNSTTGVYTIVDGNTDPAHVDPIATAVDLEDPNGNRLHPTDKVDLSVGAGSLNGGTKFTFVGTAKLGNNDGLIVTDKQGDLFFLVDNFNQKKLDNGTLNTLSNVDTTHATTICFLAGTMIRTPDGELAVETLKRGDHVLTHDGRSMPVDWLGIQIVSVRFADKMRVLPIRIRAGALGDGVPSRDLLVSPDHAILIHDTLVHAGALVNDISITREIDVPQTFTYYHVEVHDHSLILAENTPAETFVDNVDRLNFDNWAEHEALYPNGKEVAELPYPRAKSHRQVPVRVRAILAERARVIGAEPDSSAVA